MNHLRDTLSQYWLGIQSNLFPWLSEELGVLTEKQQQLITVLEMTRPEEYIPSTRGYPGRPKKHRAAIARAFVAKMVYHLPTTRALLDRLACDAKLRRICGWEKRHEVAYEWDFSRAFAEFAETELPTRIHEALIKHTHKTRLVGHISRDSTKYRSERETAS